MSTRDRDGSRRSIPLRRLHHQLASLGFALFNNSAAKLPPFTHTAAAALFLKIQVSSPRLWKKLECSYCESQHSETIESSRGRESRAGQDCFFKVQPLLVAKYSVARSRTSSWKKNSGLARLHPISVESLYILFRLQGLKKRTCPGKRELLVVTLTLFAFSTTPERSTVSTKMAAIEHGEVFIQRRCNPVWSRNAHVIHLQQLCVQRRDPYTLVCQTVVVVRGSGQNGVQETGTVCDATRRNTAGVIVRLRKPSQFVLELSVPYWRSTKKQTQQKIKYGPGAQKCLRAANDYTLSLWHKLDMAGVFLFHQDNNSKHTAMETERLLYNAPRRRLTPPQSPDANPMEHLLEYLGKQLCKGCLWKSGPKSPQHTPQRWCGICHDGDVSRQSPVLRALLTIDLQRSHQEQSNEPKLESILLTIEEFPREKMILAAEPGRCHHIIALSSVMVLELFAIDERIAVIRARLRGQTYDANDEPHNRKPFAFSSSAVANLWQLTVRRDFRRDYNTAPPTAQRIRRCLCKGKLTGRPCVSDEDVGWIQKSFVCSSRKSSFRASRELVIPHRRSGVFCVGVCYSKERVLNELARALLQVTRPHFSALLWGSQRPHAVVELHRDSHKVNVFRAVSRGKVYGPFFFSWQHYRCHGDLIPANVAELAFPAFTAGRSTTALALAKSNIPEQRAFPHRLIGFKEPAGHQGHLMSLCDFFSLGRIRFMCRLFLQHWTNFETALQQQ
ncbi:hypothetical protein PR048_030414 [Dryococelus australis]|uniref:Uncharacterized protein n=1 Tax=Dryococelus australis TaxID=614101 RepID=A0ABQ9GBS4_9NEOP|nr:hypothetical protein PR048_030414 [Dryococelus australis]